MQSVPSPALALCPGCGAAWPLERDRCGVCGASASAIAAPLAPDARWARLECQFRCTGCGASSPLERLDASSAECAHCGLAHALDTRVFGKILPLAHDVVDLAGADPAVRSSELLQRDNPYRIVGASVSDWSWSEPGVVRGREALAARVSPGHPLCAGCRAPLRGEPSVAGLRLACPSCGASELHAPLASTTYPALRAIASVATRTDLRAGQSAVGHDGVARVHCPHCGAPVTPDERSALLTCDHCHQPSLISAKLWYRLGRREPRPEPIWLLLAGRSPRRASLEDRSANVDPFELELQARARAVLAGSSNPAPTPSFELAPAPRAARGVALWVWFVIATAVVFVLLAVAGAVAYFLV